MQPRIILGDGNLSKQAPQQIAFRETTTTVLREGHVVRHVAIEPEAAKPDTPVERRS
jgi:hypothetical protein